MSREHTYKTKDPVTLKELSLSIHTYDSLIRTVVAEALSEASEKTGDLKEGLKLNINLELSVFEECLILCHGKKCVVVCPSEDTMPALRQVVQLLKQ